MVSYIPRSFMWGVLFCGLMASAGHSQTPVPLDSVFLSPGDGVKVTVWRRPELTGEFTISGDGSINHPLLKAVKVAGVSFNRASEEVRRFLATLEADPQFVMEPLLRVSVGGEVRQPSLYRLPPETSVAEAVAIAGGVTDRGRIDRVQLVRLGDSVVARIDLTDLHSNLSRQTIRSGDQIFVERRTSFWREYVTPAGSVVAALASLINILTR